jgi:SprT-like domain-contaning protein Spartan
MYQCAGICYSRRNRLGMSITIRLSEPLLKLRSRKDLIETLLHEMIHAWNFVRGVMEENGGHGQNFLAKMHEINRSAGTNISVYHTFRDEVELYKTHWWRCDGPCQNRRPFYGFVKRTSNRAPGPNDRWWDKHKKDCGGQFIKVKEPQTTEKSTKSTNKKLSTSKTPATKKPTTPSADIRKFFKPTSPTTPVSSTQNKPVKAKTPEIVGDGNKLGGSGNGRSRLLDMFTKKAPEKRKSTPSPPRNSNKVIEVVMSPGYKSYRDSILAELGDVDDDDILLIDDEFDDNFPKPIITSPDVIVTSVEMPSTSAQAKMLENKCHCPVCNAEINVEKINEHLDQCLGC